MLAACNPQEGRQAERLSASPRVVEVGDRLVGTVREAEHRAEDGPRHHVARQVRITLQLDGQGGRGESLCRVGPHDPDFDGANRGRRPPQGPPAVQGGAVGVDQRFGRVEPRAHPGELAVEARGPPSATHSPGSRDTRDAGS